MIDIITPCFNSADTIRDTLVSVKSQGNVVSKHIIIDGKSSDSTLRIVAEENQNCVLLSEKDKGIYDALNKGLSMSSADIVGILHSDDVYSNSDVLLKVVETFQRYPSVDIVYGNLIYTDEKLKKVKRVWRDPGSRLTMHLGWMPPHPSTFYRKNFIASLGQYNTNLKISGDYEYLIRLIYDAQATLYHLDEVLVKMRAGGASNKSVKIMCNKTLEDLEILRESSLSTYKTLIFKNLRKIKQFPPLYRLSQQYQKIVSR
jgi:glycosyltransferase